MKSKNKAKNSSFNTILIAICSFVGVGFISGAEIWFYFARFGLASIFGVVIFGSLCFVLTWFCMSTSGLENMKVSKLKKKISIVGEMAVASAMVSGLFETTREIFEKWWIVVFIIAIATIIILYFLEQKSFTIYNYFVAIFIVFVIVSLFVFNNYLGVDFELNFDKNFSFKTIFFASVFACFYVFSNIAELRPILEKDSKKLSKKSKFKVSLILSLLLIFLVIMLEIVLVSRKEISKFSMPFLMVFKRENKIVLFVFLMGLVMTMISTAEACLMGIKDKIKFDINNEKFVKTIVIITSLIIGQIPFQIFIKIIYPLVAILNFLVFLIEIFEMRKIAKFKFKQN